MFSRKCCLLDLFMVDECNHSVPPAVLQSTGIIKVLRQRNLEEEHQLSTLRWRRLWRMQSITVHAEMQHIFLFFSFLSPHKGQTSFVWAPISPLRPFCASLWLGSKHIMGVRGVKSFVVVIMGSPLLSNHELLKTTLRSSSNNTSLCSCGRWQGRGQRRVKPEWARSCVLVAACGMEFWMRSQQPSREERKMFQKDDEVVSGRSETWKKTREENYGWSKRQHEVIDKVRWWQLIGCGHHWWGRPTGKCKKRIHILWHD